MSLLVRFKDRDFNESLALAGITASADRLAWNAQGQKVEGVGLRLGDTLAVTWQDPATKEAAVAAYIMMPDGGLKGRWAPIGAKTAGTEEWTRKP